MDVLMFGWELPPNNSGGLGVACHGLAKGLSHHGVNISFALPRRLSTDISFMKILEHTLTGVNITAINSLLEAYLSKEEYQDLRSELNELELKMYSGSMYDEALRFGDMAKDWSRNQKHEIIHVHDWMTYPAGIKARKISGKPLVAHIHATEYDRTGGNVNEQIADIEYQGLNRADKVIAVSHYTKDVVNKYYGVPKDRIEVIHNGVDLNEFSVHKLRELFPRDKIVLFVGRLTYQKGVNYLLESAVEVLKTHPRTIFLIVGHGDMYQKLVLDAAKLGIGNRTIFPGFLTGEKLRDCYQMADVFVMPSVSEPYGIVALEALASGTPSVISKQSGVSETLNSVLKVDFWDTKMMAEKISTLLEYPSFAKEMASMAKREAAMLTWDSAAEKTLAVYKQLI